MNRLNPILDAVTIRHIYGRGIFRSYSSLPTDDLGSKELAGFDRLLALEGSGKNGPHYGNPEPKLKDTGEKVQRAIVDRLAQEDSLASSSIALQKLINPRQMMKYLDEHVVGQARSKKIMSVAIYNHYLRVNQGIESKLESPGRASESLGEPVPFPGVNDGGANNQPVLEKSNILVIGPSGSGKTMLARTIAQQLNVPFSISDCTSLTQAGYMGEDVDSCIKRLLIEANYDVVKAERGIIVLDECDKLAKSSNMNGSKDISGEGVQQSLLKLIEGTTIQVRSKRSSKTMHNKASSPVGEEQLASGSSNSTPDAQNEDMVTIDTSNILFILMGAFVGLDKHIASRVFRDSVGMKPIDLDNMKNHQAIEKIEFNNGREVAPLSLVQPSDLISYGMIPELIGRVPVMATLTQLVLDDMIRILTEPKNAIIRQYEYIFKKFDVKLAFTQLALNEIAKLALKEKTGARGLRNILERLLLDINFECPGSSIKYVLIDKQSVKHLADSSFIAQKGVTFTPRYFTRGNKYEFYNAVQLEDPLLATSLERETSPSMLRVDYEKIYFKDSVRR